jgi:choline dehydrogenase-like flavoprotein
VSAQQFDARMRDLPYLSLIGILLRDRSAGRVRIDRLGRPVIHYALSRYDQQHVRTALLASARILQATGAQEITTSQYRLVTWRRAQSLDDWIARADAVGYGVHETIYGSWHQMGTCRIGRTPDSAVDASGEVHGVRNAFVADGSLFPSASGVNPMLSIAALAYQVAQRVNTRLHQPTRP